MPQHTDISSHREKIADLADRFAIKNFVLTDHTQLIPEQPLDELLVFNGFVLTICLKGKAVLKVNHRKINVEQGEIFTYMPNQLFCVKERSDDFIIENLFLSSDFVLTLPLPQDFDIIKNISQLPVIKITPEVTHNMLEYHSLIAKSHRRKENVYSELQTKALIFALLMEVAGVYSSTPIKEKVVSRQGALADDFFRLMLQAYKTERNVAYYADQLCLSPKYLSTTIKKVTGYPISEWINRVVIAESKRLLKVTNHTVLQISEELNFPNPSFFGKFFKHYTGMTPLQYKNS